MNRRVVFVRDNLNKHSIRSIVAAYEKHFPDSDYYITNPNSAYEFVNDNDILLFSSATRSISRHISLSEAIKSKYKNISTVIGGSHATAKPEELLNSFDIVALGEGELILKDILTSLDKKKDVVGIVTSKPISNLDDYHVFPRKIVSLGPIELIRGCPSRCAFCQTPSIFPGKLRYRSVSAITTEIEFALSRKGYADIRFIAPDASSYYYKNGVNIAAIEELLSTIRGLVKDKGKIFFGTFPSELDPSGVTKELVDLLVRYCNNKLIVIGLQSASERMQKVMQRKSGIKETENAISLLLNNNFEIVVDLIFGLPYEDEFSYEETLKFIERWKGKVTIHAHPYDPLPGSKWELETPTPIPDNLIKSISSLEGIGKVFGRVQ